MTRFIKGCIAFSLVALVVVIVLAINEDEPSFIRYAYVNESINQGAEVLAADADGAVTQTATGAVLGFEQGSADPVWKQSFEPFDNTTNSIRSASAQCSYACPSAMVTLPDKTIGVGQMDPTGSLARALGNGDSTLVKVVDNTSIFVNDTRANTTGLFAMKSDEQSPGPPTSLFTGLRGASYVGLAQNARAAVVGVAGSDNDGDALRLRTLLREDRAWTTGNINLSLSKDANACISGEGRFAAAVDRRLRVFPLQRSNTQDITVEPQTVGPRVASGTCTIDDYGSVTLLYNPIGGTDAIEAVRFSATGRQLWSFSYPQAKLLTKADSYFYAIREVNGTLRAFDIKTGRQILEDPLTGVPPSGHGLGFGRDAIVRANRKGEPTWLLRRAVVEPDPKDLRSVWQTASR